MKKKSQSKAKAATSFGKIKGQVEPAKETSYTYEEKVYTYKDGSCRVTAPKYKHSNHD